MTLQLHNTLSREKEIFTPLLDGHVGMYVCGPTVYGDPHLGHARSAITFDIVFRTLKYLGYKVRYVRNITDVGHLENDADVGEDKIAKKARLEQLEPMEVVHHYTRRYHKFIDALNCQRPSIEPSASGHIIEQIQMIEKIMESGFAYEVNGSVYFDVVAYNKENPYGQLSGRNIDDLLSTTRDLDGQDEKRNSVDFALWKKANPEHIMRWPSPWSDGFPGWHLECSAMSSKYLGDTFDIHGGGMDLLFPHHEAEIAQSNACNHKQPVKYWLHNNMITIAGKKMGKSLGNFITLEEFFTGNHKLLSKAFDPMTIRFFILQTHYRSTADFSDEALLAAEKGLQRLFDAQNVLQNLKVSSKGEFNVDALRTNCEKALKDDFNTPIAIAHLFDAVKYINSVAAEKARISAEDKTNLIALFNDILTTVLGLENVDNISSGESAEGDLMDILIDLRKGAKTDKNFALADAIRDQLAKAGIVIKDGKEGTTWEKK